MKIKSSYVALLAAAVGLVAFAPVAAADHSHPAKAKKLQLDLVPAYNQCTAPDTNAPPPLPASACTNPTLSTSNQPTNQMTLAPKGKLSAKYGAEKGDISIGMKGKRILNNGTPISGDYYGLIGTGRLTDRGCGLSYDIPCTVVDAPLYHFGYWISCSAGSCVADGTANVQVPNVVHSGDQSNVEASVIYVQDRDGDAALRQGLAVGRPAGKQLRVEFVTAHNPCVSSSSTHRPSYTLPGCVPVASSTNNPANVLDFSAKGSLGVKLNVKADDIRATGTGKGILDNGTPFNGTLDLVSSARITSDRCGSAPNYVGCTLVDTELRWPIPCVAGKCKLDSSANTVTPAVVQSLGKANIELGQLRIEDPDGDDAFRQGLFVK